MTGTCPTCGSPVRVVGDPVEGTMHYESVAFDSREFELIAAGLAVLATHYLEGPPAVEIATLRTKVLELAFMEVSRDA